MFQNVIFIQGLDKVYVSKCLLMVPWYWQHDVCERAGYSPDFQLKNCLEE